MGKRKYDLEERLLAHATDIIRLVEQMPRTRAARHIGDQLLRFGTSPYLHHGEARTAESRRDFIHKMRICLKELEESRRALRLIRQVPLTKSPETMAPLLRETDELIRIFAASISTAQSKLDAAKREPNEADGRDEPEAEAGS